MATSSHLQQVRSKGKRKTNNLEYRGRNDEIFETGVAVRPENPHFVWRFKGGNISHVYVPRKVIDCCHLKIPNVITLIDERGKKWEVRTSKCSGGRLAFRLTDWGSMCKANLVDIGDACICEFMQRHIDMYIRVHIIRVNEVRIADIFEPGRAVLPENPYFVWKPTSPESMKRALYLPKKVTDCYNFKILNSLSLMDERGNEWETKIIKMADGRLACSSVGWGKLCDANHIGIGDRCICEFRQGSNGLAMHVHVIRAQADRFTGRKGAENESVEQVDGKSTYENDCNDGSGMQRNIFEGKHKFKSVSSFPPDRRSMRKETAFRSRDLDILESERAVQPENPYFVWKPTRPESMKMPLYIPKKLSDRYNLKILNSLSLVDERRKEWETKLTKRLDGRVLCSTTGWGKLCDVNHIGMGDRCICEFRQGSNRLAMHVRIIRAQADRLTIKKGVEEETVEQVDVESTYENDFDENAQDESGMQRNVVEGKSKLNTAPVRRSLRKRKTSDQRKVFEEEKIEQIDEEKLDLKGITEDVELGAIENQDANIKKVSRTVISKDVNQKRRKLSRHKNDSSQGKSIGSSKCLPKKLELLQSYFQLVGKKAAVSITLPCDVFGKNYKICIFLEDVKKFCKLKAISNCCIISYAWYLHRTMKTENLLHRFLFVNPNCISYASTREKRACALADRLIGASTDQLVLAPCNVGLHWILTVIVPYNKTVFLLDPLSHRIRDEDWRDVVNDALSMFSASKGDEQLKLARWEIVKAHLQPDAKQCGFYIMRYMRQIIQSCRDLGSISLHSMFTKEEYSKSEIDEIRTEWAEFVLDHIGTTKDKS